MGVTEGLRGKQQQQKPKQNQPRTKQQQKKTWQSPNSTLDYFGIPFAIEEIPFPFALLICVFNAQWNCVNIGTLHPIPSQLQRATTETESSLTENIQPAQGACELYFTLGKGKEVTLSHFLQVRGNCTM